MAEYLIKDTTLTAIADAIRTKTGGTAQLPTDQMPTEIAGIETGITPTGTLTITENGTHDVAEFASVEVAVPGEVIEEYDGTITIE